MKILLFLFLGLFAGLVVWLGFWVLWKVLLKLGEWLHVLTHQHLSDFPPKKVLRAVNEARRAEGRRELEITFYLTPRDFSNLARAIVAERGIDLSRLPPDEAKQELAQVEDIVLRNFVGGNLFEGPRTRYDKLLARVGEILSGPAEEPSARALRRAAEAVLDKRRDELKDVKDPDAFLRELMSANPTADIKAGKVSFLNDENDLGRVLDDCLAAERLAGEHGLTVEGLYRTAISVRGSLKNALQLADELTKSWRIDARLNWNPGDPADSCEPEAFRHAAVGTVLARRDLSLPQLLTLSASLGLGIEELGFAELEAAWAGLRAAQESGDDVEAAEARFQGARHAAKYRYESLKSLWRLLDRSYDRFFKWPLCGCAVTTDAGDPEGAVSLSFEYKPKTGQEWRSGEWRRVRVREVSGSLVIEE